jgi:hypothetical protein
MLSVIEGGKKERERIKNQVMKNLFKFLILGSTIILFWPVFFSNFLEKKKKNKVDDKILSND